MNPARPAAEPTRVLSDDLVTAFRDGARKAEVASETLESRPEMAMEGCLFRARVNGIDGMSRGDTRRMKERG